MALPPEISARLKRGGDVKVELKQSDGAHAIIQGKTAVPFGSFVRLVLKRKVQTLFRDWQDEPVIVSSELLTKIASAAEDTHEDKSKVILTGLIMGFCYGIALSAITLLFFMILGIRIGIGEIVSVLGVMLLLALAVFSAMRIQTKKMQQQFIEKVEKVADLFAK